MSDAWLAVICLAVCFGAVIFICLVGARLERYQNDLRQDTFSHRK